MSLSSVEIVLFRGSEFCVLLATELPLQDYIFSCQKPQGLGDLDQFFYFLTLGLVSCELSNFGSSIFVCMCVSLVFIFSWKVVLLFVCFAVKRSRQRQAFIVSLSQWNFSSSPSLSGAAFSGSQLCAGALVPAPYLGLPKAMSFIPGLPPVLAPSSAFSLMVSRLS